MGLENRDANSNVRFQQADTLQNIFQRLARRDVYINHCRMDCGSFSEEIIRTVHGYCRSFYIRASRCESLYRRAIDWEYRDRNAMWKNKQISLKGSILTVAL